MPALVVKLALALGFDTLLQWALRTLVALMIIGLLVTLIVVETVAGVLTGGRTNGAAGTVASVGGETHIVIPVPNSGLSRSADLGTAIVDLAQTWLGVPYVFGGCTHAGVDCSCLVQNVYAGAGVRLPRVAVDQFNATVPVSDPQPGDLIFLPTRTSPGSVMSVSTSATGCR